MKNKRLRGFTLIEIMIVVAILGILAAIAYPSYQEQVRRSRRADAQATLAEAAQWMERFYSQNDNYTVGTQFATNSGLTVSPRGATGTGVYYNITLVAASSGPQAYVLRATRANAMGNDVCGNFLLSNVGLRSQDNNTRSDCWGR